jgi:hypothetical protein
MAAAKPPASEPSIALHGLLHVGILGSDGSVHFCEANANMLWDKPL